MFPTHFPTSELHIVPKFNTGHYWPPTNLFLLCRLVYDQWDSVLSDHIVLQTFISTGAPGFSESFISSFSLLQIV